LLYNDLNLTARNEKERIKEDFGKKFKVLLSAPSPKKKSQNDLKNMTKKILQAWYNNGDINYSQKETLNKIGINDYNYYYLQDLKQILNCENWAKGSSEIRSKLAGRIKKIIFFTPSFNDSKPDASNYSNAIVTDGNNDNWVIVYRPSYVRNIQSDVFIQKVENSVLAIEAESRLNGDYPIFATVSSLRSDTLDKPFVRVWKLSSDAKHNPDKYIFPFDIVKRESSL